MKKNAKSKRADAERAAEWYAHEIMGCKRTVRAVKTQWQRHDMFACDVLGKRADGSLVGIQVTTGDNKHGCVSTRKRKLENEIWHVNDTVHLIQLVSTENPGKGARKLWFFRVFEYFLQYNIPHKEYSRVWITLEYPVLVPKEWFKVFKKG